MTARRRLCIGTALLLAGGCSDHAPREPSAAARGDPALDRQVAGDLAAVRLKMAEARIVALERQVGEMQARPEKLDLQLLTQRVEALEARVYARTEAGDAPRAEARRPQPQPSPSPSPTGRFNPFGL